ncbi:hypothetical protein, partial [Mycobacterium persicum]|uniref:hypothetical protein n=1 Tax=Mycobacterium persicum TaxID=1487726 RepID=UPI0019683149
MRPHQRAQQYTRAAAVGHGLVEGGIMVGAIGVAAVDHPRPGIQCRHGFSTNELAKIVAEQS